MQRIHCESECCYEALLTDVLLQSSHWQTTCECYWGSHLGISASCRVRKH